MEKCRKCNAQIKVIKKEYHIKSRNKVASDICYENAEFYQCKVCDYCELTEVSQKLVDMWRKKLREDIQKQYGQYESQDVQPEVIQIKKEENGIYSIKEKLKTWIS